MTSEHPSPWRNPLLWLIVGLPALAVELNNRAVKAAERRVAEVVRTAGEQREQAERELADASDTVQDLEAQLDAKIVEHQATQERLTEVMVKSQGQEVELAQMRERCAAGAMRFIAGQITGHDTQDGLLRAEGKQVDLVFSAPLREAAHAEAAADGLDFEAFQEKLVREMTGGGAPR